MSRVGRRCCCCEGLKMAAPLSDGLLLPLTLSFLLFVNFDSWMSLIRSPSRSLLLSSVEVLSKIHLLLARAANLCGSDCCPQLAKPTKCRSVEQAHSNMSLWRPSAISKNARWETQSSFDRERHRTTHSDVIKIWLILLLVSRSRLAAVIQRSRSTKTLHYEKLPSRIQEII